MSDLNTGSLHGHADRIREACQCEIQDASDLVNIESNCLDATRALLGPKPATISAGGPAVP